MELNNDNFQKEIESGLVLVDFWAEWCGPCQAAMPVLAEFEEKTGVKVGKVNVDDQPELSGQFRVMSIPTMILFKDGQPAEQMVGVQDLETLTSLVEKHK